MKLLLTTFCIALLSFNHSSYALVDPDSLDPSMPVVSYLIPTHSVKIASYKQGAASHLSVMLCYNCQEKTYPLASSVILKSFRQPLDRSELTINLLKKNFDQVRLGINRMKGEIIYLHLGASINDELSPDQKEIIHPAGAKQ